jgi:hypothetical protein
VAGYGSSNELGNCRERTIAPLDVTIGVIFIGRYSEVRHVGWFEHTLDALDCIGGDCSLDGRFQAESDLGRRILGESWMVMLSMGFGMTSIGAGIWLWIWSLP